MIVRIKIKIEIEYLARYQITNCMTLDKKIYGIIKLNIYCRSLYFTLIYKKLF